MEVESSKKKRPKMKSNKFVVSTDTDEAQIQIRFVTKQQQ